MMLGLSSYSLDPAIASGEMTLYDAIGWAAAQGAECMELVPFSFTFMDDERHIDSEYIKKVVRHAKDAGIKLCNYSVLADLCKEDPDALRDEVARVKRHVDVAAELGVPEMRHDVSAFRRPHGENGLEYFEKLMPLMVESAGAIADHAAQYGITTLIENHGFFANGCDRVERIIRAVNRPNYGLLLDTGNIACVDEEGPFIVPMSFGYDWADPEEIDADAPRLALWVHSAGVGRKVDAFNREPRVAIEMDVQEGLITGTYACAYSYAYRSIMGTGTIHRIQGIEAKRYGLTRIMQHLAPEASTDFTDQALARANIYCIDIDRFTGKQRA